LATAVQKAKDNSVPKDNIDRAIARGAGETDGVDYVETFYEGYASGGVALYVQILTDNRNRAASDVRAAFNKNGGNLGEPGSVGYLFEQKGQLFVNGDEESVMLAALEGGAEDVTGEGDQWEVITAPTDLGPVRSALESAGLRVESGDVTYLPSASVPVDADGAPAVLRLIDALEDLDDVQAVFANFDIDEDVFAELSLES
ncbi:MAG: YebC/PmpR family DNA-binding transcriptional regulator, partial [Acidimicrobiia bacterium]|nr:YebC/PmpR family DNA-binding transcriptional regulator [Acidimicrobiia bacterium]